MSTYTLQNVYKSPSIEFEVTTEPGTLFCTRARFRISRDWDSNSGLQFYQAPVVSVHPLSDLGSEGIADLIDFTQFVGRSLELLKTIDWDNDPKACFRLYIKDNELKIDSPEEFEFELDRLHTQVLEFINIPVEDWTSEQYLQAQALNQYSRAGLVAFPKSQAEIQKVREEAERIALRQAELEWLAQQEPQVDDTVMVNLKSWEGIVGRVVHINGTSVSIRFQTSTGLIQVWNTKMKNVKIISRPVDAS